MKSILKFLHIFITNYPGKIIARFAFMISLGVVIPLILRIDIEKGIFAGIVAGIIFVISGIMNDKVYHKK